MWPGGEGYPLHQAYTHQLETAEAERFADRFDLLRRTAALIKEGGEAQAAPARLCLADATKADRRAAQRELAEAFELTRQLLPLLKGPATHRDAGPTLPARAPP